MRGVGIAIAWALLSACISVSSQPVKPINEGPIPKPFAGDEPPTLVATEIPGVLRAPALAPNVYFHEEEESWYRYAYRRWYQAFRWNGHWFILEQTPAILAELELALPQDLPADMPADIDPELRDAPRDRHGLPTIPEFEDPASADPDLVGVPRDKYGLPTLPEYEDPDDQYEDPDPSASDSPE